MMKLTHWGYSVDGELADLISVDDFDAFTAGKFSGDVRIEPNITACSMAIRNYCGWHLYPELPCKFSTTFFDRRVSEGNGGILIQLPARFVTAVSEVMIGDTACDKYVIDPSGLLKVYNVPHCMEYTPIVVRYTAGLPYSLMNPIFELAAHRVIHAAASSYGVTSEAAGGVSITYNASWAGNSSATALTDDGKEVLGPYRVGGVF